MVDQLGLPISREVAEAEAVAVVKAKVEAVAEAKVEPKKMAWK
jgi:hypothetical protein